MSCEPLFDAGLLSHVWEDPADFLHLYEFKTRKITAILEDQSPTDFEQLFRMDCTVWDALYKQHGVNLKCPTSRNGAGVSRAEKLFVTCALLGSGCSYGFMGQVCSLTT